MHGIRTRLYSLHVQSQVRAVRVPGQLHEFCVEVLSGLVYTNLKSLSSKTAFISEGTMVMSIHMTLILM